MKLNLAKIGRYILVNVVLPALAAQGPVLIDKAVKKATKKKRRVPVD